ncbi:AAA family ATPase [Bacteroides sp.]|uniref:AAA family ATPase n=1 Tax=Bacteroides sp. TaxID=29523 RepID=UPI00345CE7D1
MTHTTPLKIGLSGTHCCGKTTLVSEFNKQYNTYPIISEIAATFPKKSRTHFPTQLQIMDKQILTEKQYINTGFLSDRTVIDNLAYCYYHYTTSENPDDLSTQYSYATKKAYLHLYHNAYDVIFFITDYFPHDNAKHRDLTSIESQNTINQFLTHQYTHLTNYVPVVKISGTTESRLSQINDTLNFLMK